MYTQRCYLVSIQRISHVANIGHGVSYEGQMAAVSGSDTSYDAALDQTASVYQDNRSFSHSANP